MAKKIPKIVKEIKSYQPEPINYSFQKGISFSQLSMYRGCNKRWSLQYRDGHKKFTSTIHTVFGTALHETLQHYLDVMYDQSGVAADKEDTVGLFEDELRKEYQNQYKKNNNEHFSSSEELREFFEDGVEIINFFKKKKGKYFSKRGWHLVGCEIPVMAKPHPFYSNVIYQGFLDVVMYHEPTNKFKIIDIKTSTRSWGDKQKKDENKQAQLILYKRFFSEQFNIPLEDIEIEFFIVKRKVPNESDFPAALSRIQTFTPPSGKIKLGKANKSLKEFIEEVFNKEGYKSHDMVSNPGKWNCSFCPYAKDEKLCGLGKAFS